jgi:SAM-dependent methyltransferase
MNGESKYVNEALVQYRNDLMWHVLQRVARTRFDSIIDFGCGAGENLRVLARKVNAKKAAGIDLRLAEVLSGPVVLICGNLLEYVPDAQYQLVISNQVFEHIYEPWLPKYFAVLKASCAPQGIMLISTPNRWRPKNILRVLTFRRPYMMSQNPGIPPEQHLGHHRECSYRELETILQQYFQEPEWDIRIMRTVPRIIESRARWLVNILLYFLLWVFWRPLLISASQDHYVIIQRNLPTH